MTPNSSPANLAGYPQNNLLASFDSIVPEVRNLLFQNYGDQFLKELKFIYDMGAKRGIQNANGGFHFEEERYDSVVTVKANASTSGTTLRFTLDNNEIETIGGALYVYPQVTNILWNPSTGERFEIVSVTPSGSDVTIVANSTTGTTASVPVAGDKFGITTSAASENSGQPEPTDSYWAKINYNLQRIKTSDRVTGDAAGNKLWAEYTEDGKFVGNWLGFSRMRLEYLHLKKIIGMVVLGEKNTVGNSQSIGMMEAFSTRANTLDISGGVTLNSLYETVDLLKPNAAGNNFMVWLTRYPNNLLQPALQEEYKNANTQQVRRESANLIFGHNESSEGLFATNDFNCVIVNGITFNLRLFDLSYEPNVFGLSPETNQFAHTAYFMPSKSTTDQTGNARRHMELMYLSNPAGGVDRLMKVWQTGANAPVPTNDIDNHNTHFLTQAGLDFYAMKQCAYWYDGSLS
jgi:hypothetical protein